MNLSEVYQTCRALQLLVSDWPIGLISQFNSGQPASPATEYSKYIRPLVEKIDGLRTVVLCLLWAPAGPAEGRAEPETRVYLCCCGLVLDNMSGVVIGFRGSLRGARLTPGYTCQKPLLSACSLRNSSRRRPVNCNQQIPQGRNTVCRVNRPTRRM
jgi:hypothetical protein